MPVHHQKETIAYSTPPPRSSGWNAGWSAEKRSRIARPRPAWRGGAGVARRGAALATNRGSTPTSGAGATRDASRVHRTVTNQRSTPTSGVGGDQATAKLCRCRHPLVPRTGFYRPKPPLILVLVTGNVRPPKTAAKAPEAGPQPPLVRRRPSCQGAILREAFRVMGRAVLRES